MHGAGFRILSSGMPAPQLILPPRGSTPPALDSQGRPRSLPPDLLREASQRLGILSALGAILWFLGTLLGHISLRAQSPAGRHALAIVHLSHRRHCRVSIFASLAFTGTRDATGDRRSVSTSASRT